jgi:integral membrane protein (TIGR01906 family)
MKSPALQTLLGWVVTVLVPVALVLLGVRLLITPVFVQVEYNLPGFPEDRYGFTKEERVKWANVAIDYLLNDEGIEFLGDLTFEDGSPLYNERELGHMVDVKIVVTQAMAVWYTSLLLLVVLGLWAYFGGWWSAYSAALARGGWLTLALMGLILLSVALLFGPLFVFFHQIFFDPGTWMFEFSDTLIRLFPERFWQTAFVAVGVIAAAGGLVLGLLFRPRAAKQTAKLTS